MTRNVEIRVRGRLADDAAQQLGLTRISTPGDTFLRGVVSDGPALHGILDRLRCNGIELIEVRRLSSADEESP